MYAKSPSPGRRGLALCALWLSASSCTQSVDQPLELGEVTNALVNAVTVPARGDTYVRSLAPNQNQATDTLIRLSASGKNRGLLFFDNDAIRAAVGSGSLVSASLQLDVDNASGWGASGRPITLHRLTQTSSEAGATWNCAIDSNVSNSKADCSGTNVWSMAATSAGALPFASTASATTTIVNNQKGTLNLDVTADVAAVVTRSWAGQGFLIKKLDESQLGVVELTSRERGATGPRLVLRVDAPAASDAGVVSQTSVLPSADTTIRQGEPDRNFGSDSVLRVRSSGRNRALLRFDMTAVRSALGTGKLARAKLALSVVPSNVVWGPDKLVGAHALTQAWTETGATWNCANDTVANTQTNCAAADLWTMYSSQITQSVPFREPASSTVSVGNKQSGVLTFDVTTDIACALAGYRALPGFLIKKEVESQTGRVDFSSRESKTPPQLLLDYSAQGGVSVTAAQCGVTGGGGGTGSDAGTCQPRATLDTTCDGVDDDCDGRIDDDFQTTETQCGVGACSATGGRSCVNAAIVDSCVALPPAATDATCDGIDDDCNGVADDDYVPAASSCGAGACTRFGSTSCVAGQVQDSCVAGTPAAADATCDGIDDDCDGKLDDDFVPATTHCGIGACGATGTQSCVGGHVLDSCAPRPAATSDATCDGIDDDCDGQADDDYLSRVTRCGVGACGRAGATLCVVGHEVDSCVAGAPAASDATCDGLDDDCDGVPDDEYAITATRCGVGACGASGVQSCLNGQVVDSCLPLAAAASDASCNGVDDDCDGAVDDDYVVTTTHCGVGACAADGQLRCSAGQVVDSCLARTAAAHDSSCDGVDDNCNGTADEEYAPVCSGDALTACSAGQVLAGACDDHDACTADGCANAACAHSTISCDDGNPCTADSCDPQRGCAHTPSTGASCSDGDACTSGDTCTASAECRGAAVLTDDLNPCTDDVCDPKVGVLHQPALGKSCDDGNACTVGDACDAAGSCQPSGTRSCSDGLFCNGAEGCDPQTGCTAGSAPVVDDQIACTGDRCDEPSRSVLHEPNDAACGDHDMCNGSERCDAAVGCSPGTPLVLDDQVACTIDACDPVLGVSHQDAPIGSSCGTSSYCMEQNACVVFRQCATDLVLAAGQTVTFTGPCEINAITWNGGKLIVNGALKTPSITMNVAGSALTVAGGALLTGAIHQGAGSIDLGGTVYASLTQSGGSFVSRGQFAPAANGFVLSGTADFVNAGVLKLPVLDASNVRAGTLTNRGRLDIASNALTIASGVTFNESGSLGAADSVDSLLVSGKLTHDTGLAAGLALRVNGDATVSSTGSINVSERGLAPYLSTAPGQGSGQTYVWNGSSWVVTSAGGSRTGGSHGGVGWADLGQTPLPVNDALSAPVLLGSGGGSGDTQNGNFGGYGGGRVDLVVTGTLTVSGSIAANGKLGASYCGGGAGGSIRLRVGSLAGAGAISADGGAAPGSGGGGRIAIEYATKTHTGAVRAAGGGVNAGAGTVYWKNTASGLAEVAVDNNGNTAILATPISASDGPFARISASGNSLLQLASNLSNDWVVSGGNVTLSGDASGGSYSVSSGSLVLTGNLSPAKLTLSGGSVTSSGVATLGSNVLKMTGGSFINTGLTSLPTFDATNVSAGSFINRGRLDIASEVLTVASTATLNESGRLGTGDSVDSLNVHGVLTHDTGNENGLAFSVRHDALVSSTGSIDVSGRGLSTYTGPANSGPGINYLWDGVKWTATLGTANAVGGSHGGVGANGGVAANDSASAPVLLGGSGGSGDRGNGNNGGNGGGRVDLVVNGKLSLLGSIKATGGSANSGCGAGAGGSIRLRVGSLEGTGLIAANGGSGGAVGGGGRIALEYDSKTFTGSLQAAAGAGATAGSVSERNLTSSPVSATPATQAAGSTLCRLSAKGELDCLGSDQNGLVAQAPTAAYTRLAVGSAFACALHAAGNAQCWGNLAGGVSNTPNDVFSELAVSRAAACGVRSSNGSLVCWGSDTDGIVSGKPASGVFRAVYMGERSACARRSDDTLTCWGDNSSAVVTAAPSGTVLSAKGGDGFFCAVLSGGSLSCWGTGGAGQASLPSSGPYAAVSAGSRHACALDSAGAAVCWGDDSAGQTDSVPGAYAGVATGDVWSCGMGATGNLNCWGDTPVGL